MDLQLKPETLAALRAFREQENQLSYEENSELKVPSSMSYVAENNALYKKKEYWDERFQTEESYDWLLTYPNVKPSISHILQPNHKILIVGCGNSSFSADLYDDGFQNIVNIDFSEVVIKRMAEMNSSRTKMTWLEMDMCQLKFDASTFDIVIDKAAMDALLVDEGSVWDPDSSIISSVDQMCREVSRVLSPRGMFLQISFSQPHFRTKYLMGQHVTGTVTDPYSTALGSSDLYDWNLSVEKIGVEGGCLESFLYLMIKR